MRIYVGSATKRGCVTTFTHISMPWRVVVVSRARVETRVHHLENRPENVTVTRRVEEKDSLSAGWNQQVSLYVCTYTL